MLVIKDMQHCLTTISKAPASDWQFAKGTSWQIFGWPIHLVPVDPAYISPPRCPSVSLPEPLPSPPTQGPKLESHLPTHIPPEPDRGQSTSICLQSYTDEREPTCNKSAQRLVQSTVPPPVRELRHSINRVSNNRWPLSSVFQSAALERELNYTTQKLVQTSAPLPVR